MSTHTKCQIIALRCYRELKNSLDKLHIAMLTFTGNKLWIRGNCCRTFLRRFNVQNVQSSMGSQNKVSDYCSAMLLSLDINCMDDRLYVNLRMVKGLQFQLPV